MSAPVEVEEFLAGFIGEADEHLRSITNHLSAIEPRIHEPHPRAVRELFRSLHTLKGLAGMMGVEPIVTIAHAMETVIKAADRGGGVLPATALDPLVAGARAIAHRVRAMEESHPVATAPEDLLSDLERAASGATVVSKRAAPGPALTLDLTEKLSAGEKAELDEALSRGERAFRLEFVPTPEKAASGQTITTVRERLARLGRIVRVLPTAVPRSEAAPGGLKFVLLVTSTAAASALAEAAGGAESDVCGVSPSEPPPVAAFPASSARDDEDDALDHASRRGVVRVDVARLDRALEHLGALAVNRARILDEVKAMEARGIDVRVLRGVLDDGGRQLRRMRTSILDLRMVRLQEVLEPLSLIVRGLRNATGKSVRLRVDVGQAELDKAVAERIFPALVHLVRNAVDHGIESPSVRVEHGKPEEGVVRVEAIARSSTHLDIAITDDGAGIDPARVAERARRSVPRSDAELLEILTLPGFSTRDEITTTSGRGVGMDVVRQVVESLGGELRLENRPLAGATFRLRVPLTVAIVDAFSFLAGEDRFLVPITTIDELVEIDRGRVVEPPGPVRPDRRVRMFERRGAAIPLLSLRDALGLAPFPSEDRAIVVRRHGQPFAFAVTRMLGQHEVLVRPLADPMVRVQGVAGSADLGDGKPTLVVDLVALTSAFGAARTSPRGQA
jgi:two-component system, chemotaxis family, sensor kinase CheA